MVTEESGDRRAREHPFGDVPERVPLLAGYDHRSTLNAGRLRSGKVRLRGSAAPGILPSDEPVRIRAA